MLLAFLALRRAGCSRVYLDGSFVTAKRNPQDYDVAWDPVGVDPTTLDPSFLNFDDRRRLQKEKWGGEFFPSTWPAVPSGVSYREYFQGLYHPPIKGIVVLALGTIP